MAAMHNTVDKETKMAGDAVGTWCFCSRLSAARQPWSKAVPTPSCSLCRTRRCLQLWLHGRAGTPLPGVSPDAVQLLRLASRCLTGAAELLAARGATMLAMLVECEQPSFLDSVARHPASHSVARQIVSRLARYIGEPCPQTQKNGAPSDARGGTPDRGVPRTLHWSAPPPDSNVGAPRRASHSTSVICALRVEGRWVRRSTT